MRLPYDRVHPLHQLSLQRYFNIFALELLLLALVVEHCLTHIVSLLLMQWRANDPETQICTELANGLVVGDDFEILDRELEVPHTILVRLAAHDRPDILQPHVDISEAECLLLFALVNYELYD